MTMPLTDRWRNFLDTLRREQRYRELSGPHGIDLSSNDYLGLGKTAPPATLALSRSGQASRLLRGQHKVWEEVEAALARWHGAEAALVFTSGYVANEGLLSTLIERQDFVASDQLNHASVIDGLRLSRAERFIFRHNDLNHLDSALSAARRRDLPGRELFVVTEALFGMEGDRAPLPELADLAERRGAHLVIDEAHATGCFGAAGSGLVDAAGLRSRVCATVHTGGKALGVPGAYVVMASRLLKELLVNRCRHFLFTTALPPALGAWWLAALQQTECAHDRRATLHAAAELFRGELKRRGVQAPGRNYIVPILLGSDARAVKAAQRLLSAGFDIRAIRPPTVPPGTARLRVAIHADHDGETLRAAAAAIAETIDAAPFSLFA